ncbi:MAG: hypothetical protein JKY41_10885 [Rhodobacteraceae bacterium]|nr:hypothetical protein [Paracoccaceae bacterium]
MFLEMLKRFCRSESGAVTVDFVTITAVIVGFGMGVLLIVAPGIQKGASTITPVIQSSEGLAGRLLGTSE